MQLLKKLSIEKRGFAVYNAIVNQDGTDDPTKTEVINDFAEANWTRVSDGIFGMYVEDIFSNGLQPSYFVTNTDTQDNYGFRDFRVVLESTNGITLTVYDNTGNPTNNFNCSVLILVPVL